LKRELRALLRSMDFIADRYLRRSGQGARKFFEIYRQLGSAWKFLGLQCRHDEGYRRNREGHDLCRICGHVKGVAENWRLLPVAGPIRLGGKRFHSAKRDFPNKQAAMIDVGVIHFHGTKLSVEVHNGYQSYWPGRKEPINIATDRIVRLWEGDVECWLDSNLVHVKWKPTGPRPHKPPYGAFLSELPRKMLKKFPVLLEYDHRDQLVGVNALMAPHRKKKGA